MRLIDADALLEDGIRVSYGYNDNGVVLIPMGDVRQSIKIAPTIEAELVRHGKWIAAKVGTTETKFQCSECGREVKCGNDYYMKPTKHINASYPYCHCGAKMDLEG